MPEQQQGQDLTGQQQQGMVGVDALPPYVPPALPALPLVPPPPPAPPTGNWLRKYHELYYLAGE